MRRNMTLFSDQSAVACFRGTDKATTHVQVWWKLRHGFMAGHSDDTPELTHCDHRLPPAVCVEFWTEEAGRKKIARLRSSKTWQEYTEYFGQPRSTGSSQ